MELGINGGTIMSSVANHSLATVTTNESSSGAVLAADSRAGKYLTFQLNKEEFGIPVLQVREIMGLQDITAVPNTPAHVKGVINLRGRVIPVFCLRSRFGMEEVEHTGRTCIIVVKVRGEGGDVPLGVIVDQVSEVVNIGAADIENTPDFGVRVPSPYLAGMAKVKNRVKILLDIDQLLGHCVQREISALM
jgi:purine-binding chemotaxis protein CheW